MPSEIIGLSANQIRLNKRLFFREPNGLERIQDTYVFRNSDFLSLSNSTFINNAKFNDVIKSVVPSSDQSNFPRMRVERIEYNDSTGGLSLAIVTYVGLLGTNLPPPIVFVTPIIDNQYLFNRYILNVQYIADIGLPGSAAELALGNLGLSIVPREINGTKLPVSTGLIPQSISSANLGNLTIKYNLGWNTCDLNREDCYEDPNTQEETRTPVFGSLYYYGMIASAIQYQRYGEFAVVNAQYRDGAIYSIGISLNGCGGTSLGPCTSKLIVP